MQAAKSGTLLQPKSHFRDTKWHFRIIKRHFGCDKAASQKKEGGAPAKASRALRHIGRHPYSQHSISCSYCGRSFLWKTGSRPCLRCLI